MTREELTDMERTAIIEALSIMITQRPMAPHIADWRSALAKLHGTDTQVIVMRAYPSHSA